MKNLTGGRRNDVLESIGPPLLSFPLSEVVSRGALQQVYICQASEKRKNSRWREFVG